MRIVGYIGLGIINGSHARAPAEVLGLSASACSHDALLDFFCFHSGLFQNLFAAPFVKDRANTLAVSGGPGFAAIGQFLYERNEFG